MRTVTEKKCDATPFRSVVLMVCTYMRRVWLGRFMESVASLRVPTGVAFYVAVADNNPESEYEAYIGAMLKALPFPSQYGHQPEAGYSNARNLALELALRTPAELLAFADDDCELDAGWLEGHLRSHTEFNCDVVGGAIKRWGSPYEHGRRFHHGQICKSQATGNISFRRRLVAEGGLSLRFDPRFNSTGGEDVAFFSLAQERGAKIIFSAYPVIHDTASKEDNWLDELENKAHIKAIKHRNRVVRARKESGLPRAVILALVGGMRFGPKALIALVDYLFSMVTGRKVRGERRRISAIKNLRKVVEGFRGLRGEYSPRQKVRRGDEAFDL